ncbi:hypothetical protein FHY18_000234 [Xanthomonas arboricola]|uniref:hypothetical protein n=1 Tax=Xanthomonas sp. 3793 TaxID=3035312 RepID=UPI00216A5D76|nr:hypothetical protein [Xanthomonas sp. 3793]MCS3744704.1 hypothetical protein [Xanthomonas sp. 3793]
MGPDPEEDGTDTASGVPVFAGIGESGLGIGKSGFAGDSFTCCQGHFTYRIYPTTSGGLKDAEAAAA